MGRIEKAVGKGNPIKGQQSQLTLTPGRMNHEPGSYPGTYIAGLCLVWPQGEGLNSQEPLGPSKGEGLEWGHPLGCKGEKEWSKELWKGDQGVVQ